MGAWQGSAAGLQPESGHIPGSNQEIPPVRVIGLHAQNGVDKDVEREPRVVEPDAERGQESVQQDPAAVECARDDARVLY